MAVTATEMSALLAANSGNSTTRSPNCRATESHTNAACVPAFSFTANAASVTVGNEAALAASTAAQWPDRSSIFFVFLPTPVSGSHIMNESFCASTSSQLTRVRSLPGLAPSTTFQVAIFSDSAVSPSMRARSA